MSVTAMAFPKPSVRSARLVCLLDFACVLLVFFVAGGAPAPHINETHYLTKAKHFWDPSFCRGDLFLDSADPHQTFYWTVGWLTLWLPLPVVAWVGRVAAWLLLAAGWMSVVRSVTPRRFAAPLAAVVWLFLVDTCDFAGEWVVGGLVGKGGVEAKVFAYGFVLFGLAALARGRPAAPWIWFGAGAAFHALVGGWAMLAGLGAWLTEPRSKRASLPSLVPGLILGGSLATLGVLPALVLDSAAPPEARREAARIYVYERLPHHLAPLSLEPADFQRRALRFGTLVVGFAAVALWLHRVRSAGGTSAIPPDDDKSTADWIPDNLSRTMRFATMALLGNCAGLTIELLLDAHPLAAAQLLRYYWFRQADVMVPAALALGVMCLAIDSRRRAAAWPTFAAAAVVVFGAGHLGRITVDRWQNPIPPGVARMADPDAWSAACTWIRSHTPPDALCLIPRNAQSFKWYAQRADVANWKDVPQDAKGVIEWRRRCEELFPVVEGIDEPTMLSSPEKWGSARAVQLAQQYGADYILARSDPPLGLREVYGVASPITGGGYSVYAVDAATPSARGEAP